MKGKRLPPTPIPTLAQRALELKGLGLPDATLGYSGRILNYRASISPGAFGRLYQCLLKVKPDGQQPDVIVLEPDLRTLADGKRIPHTYAYDGKGTRLCLWWPKGRDWLPSMKLVDTFVPWTAEWLYFFELWLLTGEWSGGGQHPDPRPKRWARPLILPQRAPDANADGSTPSPAVEHEISATLDTPCQPHRGQHSSAAQE